MSDFTILLAEKSRWVSFFSYPQRTDKSTLRPRAHPVVLPAMNTDIVSELSTRFSPETVITQHEDLISYSYDGTPILKQLPKVVALVNSREDVSTVLTLAAKYRTPVVTWGSGTGLSGGSVPVEGSIVLCTTRMNHILELDTENLTMMVEPGVINIDVATKAEAVGLFYPPDPGSMKVSTIGGNVSENSGGLRGLKYGVTRDYVMGLEVVLATGEIFFTGNKCVKDVAGFSLKDIFIGSEGTLGVVTKILLKLIPKPTARKTLLAVYERMDQAASTVSAIIAAKIIPCTMSSSIERRFDTLKTTVKWVCLWTAMRSCCSKATGILLPWMRKPSAWRKLLGNTARVRSLWRRMSKKPLD
jgi:FAD/FMN-containing dehydrogenase